MAKQKRPQLRTPRGRAIYPHLNTPDTKFDANGVYTVKLAVPTVAAEEMITEIDKAAASALELEDAVKAKAKGKKVKEADLPYGLNPDNEEETIFNFKMKAKIKTKGGEIISMKPAIFDAKGRPCAKGIRVGGGSTLRIAFEPVPFFTAQVGAGVSLRLSAVQVIELKEWADRNAEGYGFEAEEGFESNDEDSPTDEGFESNDEDSPTDDEVAEGAAEGAVSDGSDF